MRVELLNQLASYVNAFHLQPRAGYDYADARKRMIFEALTQGVQYVLNNAVEGDVAEFGTDSGFSAYTIARAMGFYRGMYAGYTKLHGTAQKQLHLFDSFQGLPKADAAADLESPNVQSGRWGEGTFKGLNPEELHTLCASVYDRDKVHILPGWFRESLGQFSPGIKLSLIHLDCDLYSSTVDVLDPLFARGQIADGAMLFFDDWNCNRSSPRMGQRRAWREMVDKHRVAYSDSGDYAVLGHRFIVHTGA